MWKPIPGFEDYYHVSDNGEVWSVRKNRTLRPKIDRYGYPAVTLTVHGKSRYFTVHRLVALAFIPNPDCKPTVNHKNEVKTDNRVSNLEWATSKENDNHGTRNSRMAHSKCRRRVIAQFTDGSEQEFDGVKSASRASGIAHSMITRCCRGLCDNTHGIKWRYQDEDC